MKKGIILFCVIMLFIGVFAAGPKVTIEYFNRPPYYIKNTDGTVGGFLIEITKLIFKEAGVDYEFVEIPSARILEDLKNPANIMSIGWFKNPDREKLYTFSNPIYQDDKWSILINSKNKTKLSAKPALKDIFASKMILGKTNIFSYGSLDPIIASNNPLIMEVSGGNEEQMLNMILKERFDYIFLNSEQAFYFLENNPDFKKGLISLKVSDSPAGNFRYLMFSKGIDKNVLDKINNAINKVKGTDTYKKIITDAIYGD